jgi:CMP-N-acetylneuraminic acid synthetase/spore coat polysaccharide biosynthesis predicted glycosyltransferase SpsG
MYSFLIIIPARGGSKGIPRKNIRLLNGKPLISYSIELAKGIPFKKDIYVSSDSSEILSIAKLYGAKKYKRPEKYSTDEVTLDPVIYDLYSKKITNNKYDFIITLQPTSPLLSLKTLVNAIEYLINNPNIDALISAKESRHLSWKKVSNEFVPFYKERLNRQFIDPLYTETGGFLITRSKFVTPKSRLGKNNSVFIVPDDESVDIDSFFDWSICEYFLSRKKILFVVSGYFEIGLGHIYNALIIADELIKHRVRFLVDRKSKLAFDKIAESNYNIDMQQNESLAEDVLKLNPDLVINDILDTDDSYIKALKKNNIKVINFEDLGPGAKYADIVINAMYSNQINDGNSYFGQKYFSIKNDFLLVQPQTVRKKVNRITISFGGVDPNNFTKKILDIIYIYCVNNNIRIYVIAGLGYKSYETLKSFKKVIIKKNSNEIADLFNKSDLIFTSGGRTTFETAVLGKPTIVLCQNNRELTHHFASDENGFINLGLGKDLNSQEIFDKFMLLVNDYNLRLSIHKKLLSQNIKNSKKNIFKLINTLIENEL